MDELLGILIRTLIAPVAKRLPAVVRDDDWVPQRLVTGTGPNPLPR